MHRYRKVQQNGNKFSSQLLKLVYFLTLGIVQMNRLYFRLDLFAGVGLFVKEHIYLLSLINK